MAIHNDLGNKGEHLAAKFLISNKYQILETNWRYLKAEVDIIALINNTLIIVEVKTRSNNYFSNPEEAINSKKIKLLTNAAQAYLIKKDLDIEVRFDVISIIKNNHKTELKHILNAFYCFD
ncbi:YraN family protein [Wenyingzhuangia sp. IMCC45533]